MASSRDKNVSENELTTLVELSVSCRNLADMDIFSKSDPICVLYVVPFGSDKYQEFGRTEVIWDNLNPDFVTKFKIHYSFHEVQKLKFELEDQCLWDSSNAHYLDADLRQVALNHIAVQLGQEDVISKDCIPVIGPIVPQALRAYSMRPTAFFVGGGNVQYDIDNNSSDLKKHDFLGAMQCTLAEIMAGDTSFKRPLTGPHASCGEIIVVCEELSSCKDQVTLQFSASNLEKKKTFGQSNPFLNIRRVNGDNSFTLVHKTETIMNTLNPTWRQLSITVSSLCNMDYDRQLKIEVFDWNTNGSHEFIGEFSTTLNRLLHGSNEFECINPALKKKMGSKYSNSGNVKLLNTELIKTYSFTDYIRSGLDVQCIVAVDFSALKPDAKHDGMLLHSADERCLYATALEAVVEVIQDYDSDKKIPAIGFGCKVPPKWLPSHVHFLNGDEKNAECDGIEGVLTAYRNAVKTLKCHSPTSFAPLINYTAGLASEHPGKPGDTYFILLIVTNGKITDMPQTLEAIVQASTLPLSIIIVGIGNGNFDDMEILDGDTARLSFNGREAASDIVQFVPLRDFMGGEKGYDLRKNKGRLSRAVLAEVPEQLLSYMTRNSVKPKVE